LALPLLGVEDVSVRFGGHMSLDDVSLDVEPSRVTGLIGPNGAGKTTLFNVVTGLQAPLKGRVWLDGVDLTRSTTHDRSQRGLARTFQRLELFGSLTARENLEMAAEIPRRRGTEGGSTRARVEATMDLVGMRAFAEQQADHLTTGQARLVELGRALVTEPKVLLLDEPASGLDADETESFARLLLTLADAGIGLFLVEHDMPLVMRSCHHIYVLDYGRVIAEGSPAEIQANQAVVEAYLGPTRQDVG
jgi:branched-chain amino acid transport system ATP-binding protein